MHVISSYIFPFSNTIIWVGGEWPWGECLRLMNIILQQMLEQIIISFLLIGFSSGLTSLTYSNCPDEFAPSNYNSSLATESQSLANSIYSNLFTQQTKLEIQASLAAGDLEAVQAQATSIKFLLPFILAAIGFTLCFILAACCCSFDKRCPPCESWKRNYIKEPYSKFQLRATMIPAVIFSVGILVATIIVFSTFNSFHTDIKMVKCGMFYSLDAALNGDQPNSWGGFAQIQSQVQNTSSLLGAAATSINSNLLGNDWIVSGMQSLQDMNLALYYSNYNSLIYTPNPVTTKAANQNINGNTPIPTIAPYFIQKSLGPNETADSMVADINSGFRVTQQLSAQAQKTYVSAKNLANSAANITSNTNSNLQSITIASTYLNNIKVSIDTFKTNFIDIALGSGLYIVQAIFGVILLGSLVSLLGIISSHIFELYGCKQMVHGGWVLLGFMYFAVLGVLFIFLAVGGLSYNFCDYYGSIITSNKGYTSFISTTTPSNFNKFFSYLDVCLFDDGNILEKFQLAEQMKSVAEVFAESKSFLNMQTAGNSLYIDTTVAPAKILSWIGTMNNYANGIPYDADPNDLSENNPFVSLSNLNKRTNQSSAGGNTTCANDLWVFDTTNCTRTTSETLFSPSANITNGVYIPPSGSVCISLNTRISQSAPSIWTASDIAQRYLALRSCKQNSSTAYNEILDYAEALTNYRDSRINLYKSLSSQLNNLLTQTNTYNTNMSTFSSSLSNFYSSVSSLNNIVTNQINGLTISANCTIIADSMRFFYNMYCVNFLYRSVKIVICCVALLLLMLAAVIVGSIFGLRYSRVQKRKKFVGQEGEGEDLKQDALEQSVSSSNSEQSQ